MIVGGGFVGLSAALALKKLGLSVAVVEKSAFRKKDSRLLTLSYDVFQWLEKLNLPLYEKRLGCIEKIVLSAQNQSAEIVLSADEINKEFLGYTLSSFDLLRTLDENSQDIARWAPDEVVKLHYGLFKRSLFLYLRSGSILEASLLIAAEGRCSSIRDFFSPKVYEYDFQQKALNFSVSHQSALMLHNKAYERFQSKGAIALLPIDDQSCGVIWIAESQKMHLWDSETLLHSLDKELDHQFEFLSILNTPQCFDLKASWALQIAFERCVLLGDTAHSLHPVAGQGLNLALRGVEHLVQILTEQIALGGDLGSVLALQRYACKRFWPVCTLSVFTSVLMQHFHPRFWSSIAFCMNLPSIKNSFMRYASFNEYG